MFSVFPAFAAANKSQYFRFRLPLQTPPLYKCRLKKSLMIEKYLVNEMNKCFILTANGRYKKIISPVPKGAESLTGDRNAKTPVFKDKFLSKFLWRVAKYNLNEQAPHVGEKWVWIKWSRLTCTLTISGKLHFKSKQSSKSLQKLHTGQIFCFAGYPSLIFTILRRGRLK